MNNRLLKNIMRNFLQHKKLQFATLVILTGSFTIISFSLLAYQNLSGVLSHWGESITMSVYLKDEATEAQVDHIKKRLEAENIFSQVKYISKDSAAVKFQEQMANYAPKLLNDPEFGNPLPSSFEASLKKENIASTIIYNMMGLVKKLNKLEGVDEVSYGQGWIENYATVVKSFSFINLVLAIILLVGAAFIVSNSIGISISKRKDEIEIYELFGATQRSIQRPFVFEGIILGFIAAAVSLIVSYVGYIWFKDILVTELGFWGIAETFKYLQFKFVALTLFLGMAMGMMGSYLCVRKVANGWSAIAAKR